MRIEYPAPEQLPQLKKLWQEAFGDEEAFIETFFSTAFAPDRCRCITEGETIAAMLYWLDCQYRGQKFAYLYAVATHLGFRGRGLCGKLMADTHAVLKARGYGAAILRPAEDGLHRMYGKMGYRDCCAKAEFSASAGSPAPIREIDRAEFSRLRREYLPEDGVIQEGENLAFLSQLAAFYTGADFLLAAAKRGEALVGMELLGNPKAAPGILAALDCKTGIFRTPGGEGGFAMMRPLGEDVPAPGYLGFVFG